MSEVFKWLQNLPGGLKLEKCSEQFESRGFSTLESLRYLRPGDVDAFFPSPEKLLLAEKRILESEIKALVDPENRRTPLRPVELCTRFNSAAGLNSNMLSTTPCAEGTAGPSKSANGQENKPLDRKANEMKENLLVLEVQISSAVDELQKLKSEQEKLTPLAAIRGRICNRCHQTGHTKTTCKAAPCESSSNCKIREKHPEIKNKISALQAELKDLQKQHEKHKGELENFTAAREKSKSSFFSVMRNRLRLQNLPKYTDRLKLDKDLLVLQRALRNEVPKWKPEEANIQLRINRQGGCYDSGRAYPDVIRERVLDLAHTGLSQRQIATELRISRGLYNNVQNVLEQYDDKNISMRIPRTSFLVPKVTTEVLEFVSVEKVMKPSIHASEIQERLLLDGVVDADDLPSASQINKRLRRDLIMSKKKLSVAQLESNTPENIVRQNEYLNAISTFQPNQIHFFDEASVIKTTGNRTYGNATVGEKAIEFQRYASNANFTINLLHSALGIDYFNIIDGPSNGFELLNFFEDAVEIQRPDRSVVLERGDCVVMDNCGFHHGLFVEPVLRDLLNDYGVQLIYQPPYSPHLNTCEYCFHQIKEFLRRCQLLAMEETKIAIAEGVLSISAANSYNYFRNCGYV
ncbi:hypothetical protein ACROYT_G017048 [Oculina patagonica]